MSRFCKVLVAWLGVAVTFLGCNQSSPAANANTSPSNQDSQQCGGTLIESTKLQLAREELQQCDEMILIKNRDSSYRVILEQDEIRAVQALVQTKHLVLHDDAGPSASLSYFIVAGKSRWGLCHNGLVLEGSTRDTTESRRYRYEHAELDFNSPDPGDYSELRHTDDHVRKGIRELVNLYARGELD